MTSDLLPHQSVLTMSFLPSVGKSGLYVLRWPNCVDDVEVKIITSTSWAAVDLANAVGEMLVSLRDGRPGLAEKRRDHALSRMATDRRDVELTTQILIDGYPLEGLNFHKLGIRMLASWDA